MELGKKWNTTERRRKRTRGERRCKRNIGRDEERWKKTKKMRVGERGKF